MMTKEEIIDYIKEKCPQMQFVDKGKSNERFLYDELLFAWFMTGYSGQACGIRISILSLEKGPHIGYNNNKSYMFKEIDTKILDKRIKMFLKQHRDFNDIISKQKRMKKLKQIRGILKERYAEEE